MNSPPPPRHDDRARHKGQDQGKDHGIERNTRGEEQPSDKGRAQQTSRGQESGAARQQPSPGQPAGGE